MIGFTIEAIWSWIFLYRKYFWLLIKPLYLWIYSDNNKSVSMAFVSLEFFYLMIVHISYNHFLISISLIITSPFSFMTLIICIFSLLFLVSLAEVFLILLVFSNKQLLDLLIFSVVFWSLFCSYPNLNLTVFFHLFIWGLVCSYFSSCLTRKPSWEIRLLIQVLYSFLIKVVTAMNFC